MGVSQPDRGLQAFQPVLQPVGELFLQRFDLGLGAADRLVTRNAAGPAGFLVKVCLNRKLACSAAVGPVA